VGESDDTWAVGDAYEAYMGRWSRPVARAFVEWLQCRSLAHWLDVGCGTSALTSTICELSEPTSVIGCDPSEAFVDEARNRVADPRTSFMVASTEDLPEREENFDAVVSGLVLNFLSEPDRAIASMSDRLRPEGFVAAYVWDYAGELEFLRYFWHEAAAMDPSATDLDEGNRFPLCEPDALSSLFRRVGLHDVETRALEIETYFVDFGDYWRPFLGGTGPAPAFLVSLDPGRRALLRNRLQHRLPVASDGSIRLRARAWAVRGFVP